MDQRARRKERVARHPPKTRRFSVHVPRTTTRDKAIGAYLKYYHYLPSNFLGHLIEGKYTNGFQKRLTKLKKAKLIHAPAKQDKYESHRIKFDVYERGGKDKYGVGFSHNLMASLIEANFEIAARKLGLQFISWEQIKALPTTPYATALSKAPFRLTANWGGEDHFFYPDGHPFKIVGPRGAYSFLFEADRDTEGNRNLTDAQRPYIEAKIRNYLAFTTKPKDDKSLCEKHFGFTSTLVLFVTTSERKCVNFQHLILDITRGKGASNILIKSFPDFLEMDTSLEPDLSFVATPWPRAGNDPTTGKPLEPFDIVGRLCGRKA
jgi:hypothetical protein